MGDKSTWCCCNIIKPGLQCAEIISGTAQMSTSLFCIIHYMSPWQNWADVWIPRAQSRATQTQDQAIVGQLAQLGHGQWSSCRYFDLTGCSSGWCSVWWNDQCRGSHRCSWCSSSLEGKMWAGETSRGPVGRSFFLHTQLQQMIS